MKIFDKKIQYTKNELENTLADFKILEITRIVFGLTFLAVVEKDG